jgi:hypothetical protein
MRPENEHKRLKMAYIIFLRRFLRAPAISVSVVTTHAMQNIREKQEYVYELCIYNS